MADTGAPYFIPYVEPSDLVRNYPAASEALADAIVAALEAIPVTIKKVDGFTGSGTFTVPAGVTYAIAHMRGGGGASAVTLGAGTGGGQSSVAFASGTVVANGGSVIQLVNSSPGAGAANSGSGAFSVFATGDGPLSGSATDGAFIVVGAAVSPAEDISVTVGAGGTAGSNGSAGGSGYVYIEYFEEA